MARWMAVWTLVLLCGTPVVFAQDSPGAGKLEVGFFPGGGLFFVDSGDDPLEVDYFAVYTIGGNVSRYLNRLLAIEGEGSIGLGLGQDVHFNNREFSNAQVPHTASVNANAVVFPTGSDRLIAPYATGGVGLLRLRDRETTIQYGVTASQNFFASNFGGGVKILRSGTGWGRWGARIDYRLFLVGSKDDAIPFFAKSTNRVGHRVYVGFLYTLTR